MGLKWNISKDIEFYKGNYQVLKAKFDNSNVWFTTDFYGTVFVQKTSFRELAKHYNAKTVTLEYMNDNDISDTVMFLKTYDDNYKDYYKFFIQRAVSGKINREYFDEKDLFNHS